MAKSVTLPSDVAAVVLDLVTAMTNPTNDEEMAYNFRRAYFLEPILEEAFAKARIDPDTAERATVPLLVPGAKYKPSQEN